MKNFRRITRKRKVAWVIGISAVLIMGMMFLYQPQLQHMVNTLRMQDHRQVDQSMTSMSPPTTTHPMPTMLTPHKRQLIGVRTAEVKERVLETTVRAFGLVEYDERRVARVNLRVSGWIEELFIDFTGQFVEKGAPLFTLYSPDLVTSQSEYLLALEARKHVAASPLPHVTRHADAMVDAARARLRLWMLTPNQIDALVQRGIVQNSVSIVSPVSGFVIDKAAVQGMYVTPQTDLYTIVDLSTIWVTAEIYEYEFPFVTLGQDVSVTLPYFPGEAFSGTVTYLYPTLNPQTRTAQVRIEIPNPNVRLKPDMYAEVLIAVRRPSSLAVPDRAVVDSGTRTVVFVEIQPGMFEQRHVSLGPKVGQYYELLDGVTAGEHVVTSGSFLIDSESQLMASSNMMGSLGMGGIKMEQASMGEMDMSGMDMP